MPYYLKLEGRIPGKKNRRRAAISPRGRMYSYLPPKEKAELEAIAWQVRGQWGGRAPLERACVMMSFVGLHGAADIDNAETAVLDVLVECGVLADDRVKNVPWKLASVHERPAAKGERITYVALLDEPPRIEIEFAPAGVF